MKAELSQEIKILSTQTDHRTQVGVLQAVSLLQDNMCEYYRNIGCDGPTMIPVCNCFFVLTKTKIKIHSSPKWLQKIVLRTDVNKLSPLRMNVAHEIVDLDGNIQIEGVQELCPMDVTTRRVKPIKETLIPKDLEVSADLSCNLSFEKFDEQLLPEELVEKIKVNTNNIDFYGHTNNLEYVKFMISTIPSADFYTMDIKTFEIHYIHESRERDVLDVYCKKSADNYYFEIKNSDLVVCKARMVFDRNK